jgi:hypothetical protein
VWNHAGWCALVRLCVLLCASVCNFPIERVDVLFRVVLQSDREQIDDLRTFFPMLSFRAPGDLGPQFRVGVDLGWNSYAIIPFTVV